ncbi:MAG: hypothetical protein QXL27_08475 [Candidatus Bathyarchaeia archaeon]
MWKKPLKAQFTIVSPHRGIPRRPMCSFKLEPPNSKVKPNPSPSMFTVS